MNHSLNAYAPTEVLLSPPSVNNTSTNHLVQLKRDPQFCPEATAQWSSTLGHIDDRGLYTAADRVTGTDVINCDLVFNGVLIGHGQSVLEYGEPDAAPTPYWERVTCTLKVAHFADNRPVRAQMFGNGAQQLVLDLTLKDENEAPLPAEDWQQVQLFDYFSHQTITRIGNPMLEQGAVTWAFTTEENHDFLPATLPESILTSDPLTSTPFSNYRYLHSRAMSGAIKKVYAGLCDKYGWWHYFLEGNNQFEAGILPYQPPQLTMRSVQKNGFDENDFTPRYPYDSNLNTTEYFIVSVPDGFKFCSVKGVDENNTLVNRLSIVRFERDALSAQHCSVTGLILNKAQSTVIFDPELLSMPLFAGRLEYNYQDELQPDEVIVTVHRLSNIPLALASENERSRLLGHFPHDLVLQFQDKYGNRFEKSIGFVPRHQGRHRNELTL
ncbi:hypothetical protein [Pseudomonas sichuanensis]|uniref:Uncharacterized protein n=1 Tax=Pseudomonas sichuanensis TaxID=2213015 RepID=A0ABV0DC98_9PSED